MALGKLMALARADAAKFTDKGGFQVDVTLTNKDGSVSISTTGTGSGKWLFIENDGNGVDAARNSIRFAESTLNSAGYPVRNTNGKVALRGHKVSFADVNGDVQQFVIEEVYPNATLGMIVCILGDSE